MGTSMTLLSEWLTGFHSCREKSVLWHGLDESARTLLLAVAAKRHSHEDMLIVCDNEKRMRQLAAKLSEWVQEKDVYVFPNNEAIPFEVLAQSDEIAIQRAALLNRLIQPHEPLLILTTGHALMQSLLTKDTYARQCRRIAVGDIIDFETLRETLVENRYQMERIVTQPGEAAVHGGIVDVFPPGAAEPVRVEFFDDEVDSLRYFDPKTQRSTDVCVSFTLTPAREFFVPATRRSEAADRLGKAKETYTAHLRSKGLRNEAALLDERIEYVLHDLKEGIDNDNIALFGAYFDLDNAVLTDYLPAGTCVFVDEKNRLEDALFAQTQERQEHFKNLQRNGYVLPKQWDYYITPQDLGERLEAQSATYFALLKRGARWWAPSESHPFASESLPVLQQNFERSLEQLRYWITEDYRVLCLHHKAENRKLFAELCSTYDLPVVPEATMPTGQPGIYIMADTPDAGAVFLRDKVVVLSCDFMHDSGKKKLRRGKNETTGEAISTLEELEKGDYVVHESHGIGIYHGIVHVQTGEVERDYLLIQYAGTDKLYVPVDQFDLLQRYTTQEGRKPKLNKLSGNEWQRIKKKVRASVRDLAENLLQIYAKRKSLPGFAYSQDTPLQYEFETRFPYVETADQLKAIKEVKRDMEQPVPMDRLVCGDVGYGKTEVAIRAAFKALVDHKQVAVLVPTTILAQQHEETFRQRFEPFAANVRALSRFTPVKEQRDILKDLKNHRIDILIGTHKLLNKNIEFADLGLLIIDEEQRFGVSHKERIKAMRSQVDVMTLTATPIPRTLHMSLVGIRDMSLIETPPEDRYPIQTYVVENQPIIMEQAIRRELSRDGQVFIVHNRIDDMERMAEHYRALVPEARILVAHGRMTENRLEDIIISFIRKEADILLCTTIIETGIDMPNVNTLIVHRADNMGLSQLYQLRGRIGRSNRVAYAYLTYERDKTMTPLAEKRLQTLKEYTALGSGYRIAMKDLEMRGAGTLLGAEQHGNVIDVGFDIYMQLLQEAVDDLKGVEKTETRIKPEIELSISAFIPESYISDSVLRLHVYQRLERSRDQFELNELLDELIDRFGDPPTQVIQLLKTIEIRFMAMQLCLRSIKQMQNLVYMGFAPDADYDMRILMALPQKFPKRIKMSNRSGELMMIWDAKQEQLDQTSLDSLKVVLETLANDCKNAVKDV